MFFSLSLGVGKMKFHYCWPPGKILLAAYWKNRYCFTMEKIVPTPMGVGCY